MRERRGSRGESNVGSFLSPTVLRDVQVWLTRCLCQTVCFFQLDFND